MTFDQRLHYRNSYPEKLSLFDNQLEIFKKDYDEKIQNRFVCIGFSGRKKKSDFHYHFKTSEERQIFIDKYIVKFEEKLKMISDYKNSRKQVKKSSYLEFKSKLVEGSILSDSWGYEQTNVEFYLVLSVQGNKIKIQELGHIDVEQNSGMSCYVMPDLENRHGEILEKTFKSDSIKLCSSISLSLWDGNRKYKSWYY